ncbi:MAG: hypothetical protein R6U36_02320 [Candidatus Fermentibacteraceae bacterium]
MLADRRRLARRLEDEARRLSRDHSGLHVRFVEVVGRRLSHLAGRPDGLTSAETRVEITPRLVALLSGPGRTELDAADWAGRLKEALAEEGLLR